MRIGFSCRGECGLRASAKFQHFHRFRATQLRKASSSMIRIAVNGCIEGYHAKKKKQSQNGGLDIWVWVGVNSETLDQTEAVQGGSFARLLPPSLPAACLPACLLPLISLIISRSVIGYFCSSPSKVPHCSGFLFIIFVGTMRCYQASHDRQH